MVVLRREAGDDTRAEAANLRELAVRHGMPIDWRERRHVAPTVHACRAVVAARLGWPDRADAFLRALRVLAMGGEPIDDSDTFELAAARAGLPVDEVAAFAGRPEVHAALEADAAAARRPSAAALAQPERLGGQPDERRYPCPSYVLEREDGAALDVPGLQPLESYEAAIANLAPGLERRRDASSTSEVLDWAPYPLATVEVAAICHRDLRSVRSELARTARFEPVGADGYWLPA